MMGPLAVPVRLIAIIIRGTLTRTCGAVFRETVEITDFYFQGNRSIKQRIRRNVPTEKSNFKFTAVFI